MKILIVAISFFLASELQAQYEIHSRLSICADIEKAYGSKVILNAGNETSNEDCTRLYYKSFDFMARNRSEKDKEKIKKNTSGGLLHLFIMRETIGGSSHENFKIDILKHGSELWKSEGKPNSYKNFKPHEFGDKWANSGSIWVDTDLPAQFSLILTEQLPTGGSNSFTYTITK